MQGTAGLSSEENVKSQNRVLQLCPCHTSFCHHLYKWFPSKCLSDCGCLAGLGFHLLHHTAIKACIAHSHPGHPTEIWARGKCNQGSSCKSRCGCLYADLAVQKIGFTPASNTHPCLLQKRSGVGTLKAKFLFLFALSKTDLGPQRVGRQVGGSDKCSSKAQQGNFTQINSSRAVTTYGLKMCICPQSLTYPPQTFPAYRAGVFMFKHRALPQAELEPSRMRGCMAQPHTFNMCEVHMHALSQLKTKSALKLSLAAPCTLNPALFLLCPVTQSVIS